MVLHALMILGAVLMAADAPESDQGKFQGTWAVILGEREGVKLSEEAAREIKVVIEGDRYRHIRGETTQTGTIRLDRTKMPKTIDVTPADGKTILGIYTIEGDTHKVCFAEYGGGRPTGFSTEPESGKSLYVMRRVKP
jgi:uncharacterized protein (TIGR03067 family)